MISKFVKSKILNLKQIQNQNIKIQNVARNTKKCFSLLPVLNIKTFSIWYYLGF